MKSTRSIIAILSMLLVFFVVAISASGGAVPGEVLAIVSAVSVGPITAYFGKRDSEEDRLQ